MYLVLQHVTKIDIVYLVLQHVTKIKSCVYETLLWLRQPKVVDPLLQGTVVVGLLTLCHSRITVEVINQKRTVSGSCGCSLHLQEKR